MALTIILSGYGVGILGGFVAWMVRKGVNST